MQATATIYMPSCGMWIFFQLQNKPWKTRQIQTCSKQLKVFHSINFNYFNYFDCILPINKKKIFKRFQDIFLFHIKCYCFFSIVAFHCNNLLEIIFNKLQWNAIITYLLSMWQSVDDLKKYYCIYCIITVLKPNQVITLINGSVNLD